MEATADECVGRHFPLADEGMTLEDFDSSCAAEDAGKEWRMI
jgi:hypothetical protein